MAVVVDDLGSRVKAKGRRSELVAHIHCSSLYHTRATFGIPCSLLAALVSATVAQPSEFRARDPARCFAVLWICWQAAAGSVLSQNA